MILRIQKLHPNLKIAQPIRRPFVLSQDRTVQDHHLEIVRAQSATFDITCCNWQPLMFSSEPAWGLHSLISGLPFSDIMWSQKVIIYILIISIEVLCLENTLSWFSPNINIVVILITDIPPLLNLYCMWWQACRLNLEWVRLFLRWQGVVELFDLMYMYRLHL